MLARVLFVLLAGFPVCRGAEGAQGAAYSAYYDADGDVQNADFYDSYNDEIKSPQKTTVMKIMDLDDITTLNPVEIIDVKGVLNNILQGKKPQSLRGRRTARDYTDSYDYLENSINVASPIKTEMGLVPKKWQPTVEVQKGTREDVSSSEATEQHWSFVYQPETSTYGENDIIAELKNMIPVGNGKVPRRSSIDYWLSTQEALTWSTTEETEKTEDTLMYPLESTTYSNSDMQAEVRKLVQHWSSSGSGNQETSSYNNAAVRADVRQLIQQWSPRSDVQHQSHMSNVQHQAPSMAKGEMNQQYTEMQTEVRKLEPWNHILDYKHWSAPDNVQHRIPSDNVQHQNPSMNFQHLNPSMNVQHKDPPMNIQHHNPSMNVQHWNPSLNVQHQDPSMNVHPWSSSDNVQHQNASVNVQHWSPTIDVQQWNPNAVNNQENLPYIFSITDSPSIDETEFDTVSGIPKMRADPDTTSLIDGTTLKPTPTITLTPKPTTTLTPTPTTTLTPTPTTTLTPTPTTTTMIITTTTTTTTTKPTTTTQRMDVDAIMAIISNLTYDYEWNLTEQFNKTIIEHGVPTCPWEKWGPGGAWTATTSASTLFPWNFENTSVVSKCFVCGLRTPEIPRNAFCADAFAGDFLPLMPIDAQSRGKIAGFRKYCRYIDTQNYIENADEPRAIYGRFTGGCAVRWTDITGVYTQRTCRSKFRPLLGKHFASKRMAKLELALVNVENGCIISPMATLLPVSRGISLYARFHACVCSTNWCNRATLEQASFNTLVTIVLAYWLVHYP